MPKLRITDRTIAAMEPGGTIWDTEVSGLGARRQASDGRIAFVFKFRSPTERDATGRGRQRMLTLGKRGRGDLGIDDARKQATAHRLSLLAGIDPAAVRDERRAAITVAELCDLYLDALPTILVRGRVKKPGTIANDRYAIAAHIKPMLGSMAVDAVKPFDVRRFMHQIAAGKTAVKKRPAGRGGFASGGKGAATRCVGLLGGIFSYAVREGMRADNPARGVERYADGKRERRVTDAEYAALGVALRTADGCEWLPAAAMTHFLILTGWRKGEAMALRWEHIDMDRRTAILPDTKTGRSLRPLSTAACDVLREMSNDGGFVFPAIGGKSLQSTYRHLFECFRAAGGIPSDITPHVLRHSFASLAGDLGLSEPTIAALVGHSSGSVTSRYIHAADAVLLAAADAVAQATMARMGLA